MLCDYRDYLVKCNTTSLRISDFRLSAQVVTLVVDSDSILHSMPL